MKKLKQLFYVVVIALLFTSCEAHDNDKCLSSVQQMFPDADVYAPHKGSNITFIVIENGSVYKVSTGSITSPEVTKVTAYIKQ